MITVLKKISALILTTALALSCSNLILLDDDTDVQLKDNLKLTVNGVVSDVESNLPIPGIKITLEAFAENTPTILPDATKTVHTDENGVYTIEASGFSGTITCTLTAESPEDAAVKYETVTNKVVVTWDGSSFDATDNTAYVNDCNFQMSLATL